MTEQAKPHSFQSSDCSASDAAPPVSPNQPQTGGANLSKQKSDERYRWHMGLCINCEAEAYPYALCRACRDKQPVLPQKDIDAMDPLNRNELEKGNDDATWDAPQDRWWPDRSQPATAVGFIASGEEDDG